MRFTLKRQLGIGAGLLFAATAGTACHLPGGNPPPPPVGGLQVNAQDMSSSCSNDDCVGSVTFLVRNVTGVTTTDEPDLTVSPNSGTAVMTSSTCDDGTLSPNESCTETYTLVGDAPLGGTVTVDAGNLEGATTYGSS